MITTIFCEIFIVSGHIYYPSTQDHLRPRGEGDLSPTPLPPIADGNAATDFFDYDFLLLFPSELVEDLTRDRNS